MLSGSFYNPYFPFIAELTPSPPEIVIPGTCGDLLKFLFVRDLFTIPPHSQHVLVPRPRDQAAQTEGQLREQLEGCFSCPVQDQLYIYHF